MVEETFGTFDVVVIDVAVMDDVKKPYMSDGASDGIVDGLNDGDIDNVVGWSVGKIDGSYSSIPWPRQTWVPDIQSRKLELGGLSYRVFGK